MSIEFTLEDIYFDTLKIEEFIKPTFLSKETEVVITDMYNYEFLIGHILKQSIDEPTLCLWDIESGICIRCTDKELQPHLNKKGK